MVKLFRYICLATFLAFLLGIPLTLYALADGQEKLFIVDGTNSLVHELDPSTGAVLNSIPTPEPSSEGPDGLAYGNGRMFFTNGYSGIIYEIIPSTGSVINSFSSPPGSGEIDALGFSCDRLFASDYMNGTIYVLNPDSGVTITSFQPPLYLVGGGTFAETRNSIFFTEDFEVVHELDPQDGSVLNSFSAPPGSTEIYGLGFSSNRNSLFLGDVWNNVIYEVDPDDGSVINSFSGPEGALITALAADECSLALPTPVVGGEVRAESQIGILAPLLGVAFVLALGIGVGILALRRR